MSELFTPYRLGPVTLRNRTIRSAAFESMGKDFNPTEQLKAYHVSVARGGVGMTTLAYASVNRSGISFNKQLWLREEIVPALRDITDAIHSEGAAAGIQIGHCGNMTHWSTAGCFPRGASTGFNLYSPTFVRGMRRSECAEYAKDFGRAVVTAHEAGFDSVEVHAGHGYLISQFLSPYTNRRRDEFGGSLENRMRFMTMCLEEVMSAAARTGTAVLVKHNMEDGFKSGIQIPESIEIAKRIESLGVDGIVLTSGFVSKAPMAVMRGRIPTKTMSYYMPWSSWPQKIVVNLFGNKMIRQYDFEECYFLENAKKFRAELRCPLVYVGGLVSREGIERVLDAGFEMVQMARALVNDPAFVNKLREGDMSTRSGCDHRDYCMARMYSVDGSAIRGGEMDPAPANIYVKPFADALEKLKPGQISEIVETEFGFHIIELIDKKGDKYHCRHIVLRPTFTREELAEPSRQLDSLARLIRKDSISFEKAALEFSDDATSKMNGGIVSNHDILERAGTFDGARLTATRFLKEDFGRDFGKSLDDYNALRRLGVGEISESFQTTDMMGNQMSKIVKLVEIIPAHTASLVDDYIRLEEMALQNKQNEVFEKWLSNKIDGMYVYIAPEFRNGEFRNKHWVK